MFTTYQIRLGEFARYYPDLHYFGRDVQFVQFL